MANQDIPNSLIEVIRYFSDVDVCIEFIASLRCKNGISSYEIARDLKVTQKSAWFMLHRIRLALKNGTWEKMGGTGGPIEVDETFIGGKPKNMHADKRLKMKTALNGYAEKTVVVGMLDRESRQVRAE